MRRSPTPRPAIAVLLALSAPFVAACATTRYTQSALAPAAPEGRREAGAADADTAVSLTIEKVKLRVETMDRAPRSQAIPTLALRLTFDPPEIGYSFDPGQVVLRSSYGREWRAAGGGYRPVFPDAVVDLAFDAVVPEGATCELVLGGLARGRTRLDPVALRLARRSGRSIDRVYWLEVLLAPLAYGY